MCTGITIKRNPGLLHIHTVPVIVIVPEKNDRNIRQIPHYTRFDKLVHIHIVPVIVIVPGIRQQHPTNSTLHTL